MNLTQAVNNALRAFRSDVPEYVGSGIVDLSTGMLLAVDTMDTYPRDILDVLAAATVDLFQGRSVTQIENMWKQQRGVIEEKHYFQEILIYSDHLVHLFLRSTAIEELVAVVICRRNVSVGMLFAMARQGMHEIVEN